MIEQVRHDYKQVGVAQIMVIIGNRGSQMRLAAAVRPGENDPASWFISERYSGIKSTLQTL